jgi:hypothetical protein
MLVGEVEEQYAYFMAYILLLFYFIVIFIGRQHSCVLGSDARLAIVVITS